MPRASASTTPDHGDRVGDGGRRRARSAEYQRERACSPFEAIARQVILRRGESG